MMLQSLLIILLATPKPFNDNVIDMIVNMGFFAKLILLVLLVFSVVSWAIIFNKWKLFRSIDSETGKLLRLFRKKAKISDVYLNCIRFKTTPLSQILQTGYSELENMTEKGEDINKNLGQEKIDIIKMSLERIGADELDKLEKGIVFLATVGNTSPFLGLLGTVWGVIDSFASIGVKGTASLAVVAPGIAEALIATVAGLAVAIPAVIGYNHLNHKLKTISSDIDKFSLELVTRIKKEYNL
jgi:biopolymer transport protein TolQ